jgi:hypothetical protein
MIYDRDMQLPAKIRSITSLDELQGFTDALKSRAPIDSATQSEIALRRIELTYGARK